MMLPLRFVLDTNVIVSTALKPDGLQRTSFLLALTKPARFYVSNAILSEYRGVLSRSKIWSQEIYVTSQSSGKERKLFLHGTLSR